MFECFLRLENFHRHFYSTAGQKDVQWLKSQKKVGKLLEKADKDLLVLVDKMAEVSEAFTQLIKSADRDEENQKFT